MKTTSKIAILILSLLAAVFGIVVYAKTIVSPPKSLEEVNQYTKDLDRCNNLMKQQVSSIEEDSTFMAIFDRILFQYQEKKIETDDADSHIDALLSKYTPIFLSRTYSKFRQSKWYEEDHVYIMDVVDKLRDIKHCDHSQALGKATLDSLKEVEKIIVDYRQARKLCKQVSFLGVENARTTIRKAKSFATDKWLSNCQDLVSSLNQMKTKIGQSHYNYVAAEVDKLSQYRYFSSDYYENTLINEVDNALKEYNNNAVGLYGAKKDTESLLKLAERYCGEAIEYY